MSSISRSRAVGPREGESDRWFGPIARLTLAAAVIVALGVVAGCRSESPQPRDDEREVFKIWALSRHFSVLANYALTDSVVTSNPSNTALVGKSVPEIPRHAGSLSIRWSGLNGAVATLRARSETARYFDAENTQTTGGATISICSQAART